MRQSLVSGVSLAVTVFMVAGSIAAAPKKPAAKAPAKPDQARIAAGKKIFDAQCMGCHKIAGKGGTSGPDLSKVGKERTMAELAKKIKDPKATNKDSIMPPFAGPAKDLEAVATYLASLK